MYTYLQDENSRLDVKTLLYFEGTKMNTTQLYKEVDKVSRALLKAGIKSGDVVAINLPNLINAVVVFYACNNIGCIANLIHPMLPVKPLLQVLTENNCKALFGISLYFDKFNEELKEFKGLKVVNFVSDYLPPIKKQLYALTEQKIEKDAYTLFYKEFVAMGKDFPVENITKFGEEDTCVYLLSGGTTGKSKTVCLSARALNRLSEDLNCVIEDRNQYRNTALMCLPMFHGFGLAVCMHAMLCHGLEVVLMTKFEAKKAANLIGKRKVTLSAGVPVMYSKLLRLPDKDFKKLKSLKNIFCGGDRLPEHIKIAFDTRLREIGSNSEVVEGYGLTEAVSVTCVNKERDYNYRNVGYCLDNVYMEIVDNEGNFLGPMQQGEICVSGNTLMNGYLREEATYLEKDGKKWLKTGDIGYKDEKGKFYFVDRKKRMFVIAGVNVFPSEIEDLVNDLEYVKDSYAAYLEKTGEIILYVVLGKGENSESRVQEIVQLCKERLLKYSVPRKISAIEKMPRTPVGKIDYAKLKEYTD